MGVRNNTGVVCIVAVKYGGHAVNKKKYNAA